MALVFTLFILIILRCLETKISTLLYKSLSVITEEQLKEDDITSVLKKHNATIYTTDYEKDVSRKEIIYHYALALKNTAPLSEIVGELSSKKGIKKVVIKSY